MVTILGPPPSSVPEQLLNVPNSRPPLFQSSSPTPLSRVFQIKICEYHTRSYGGTLHRPRANHRRFGSLALLPLFLRTKE